MTREEAVAIIKRTGNNEVWYEAEVEMLEALGLIKFDEPAKEVRKLCSATQQDKFNFRVEEWAPEGYVLWHNGKIVWKSF